MTGPAILPGSRWRRRAGGKHGTWTTVTVRRTSARAVAFERVGGREPARKLNWLPLVAFVVLFAPE
jgi:hypothetical protein